MPKDGQNDNGPGGGPNNYLKFTGVAFQMAAVIGIFTYAGLKIDESAQHTTKWVTAIFSLAGVFVSLYIIIKSLKN